MWLIQSFKKNILKKPFSKLDIRAVNFENRVAYLSNIYSQFDPDYLQPVWNYKHTQGISLRNFRADNVYVWQKRNYRKKTLLESFRKVIQSDEHNLLEFMSEDGSFGVEQYDVDGKTFSRDLADSVLEINFLMNHLPKQPLRVLDIGAGYGRFARRCLECGFAKEVFCIDAIAISTALSEFYLAPQIANGSAKVVCFHHQDFLYSQEFDLATNIHSFSEMSLTAVEKWVDLVAKLEIPWLFIVPNGPDLSLNDGTDFFHLLQRRGYNIHTRRKKYFNSTFCNQDFYPAIYYLLKLE